MARMTSTPETTPRLRETVANAVLYLLLAFTAGVILGNLARWVLS